MPVRLSLGAALLLLLAVQEKAWPWLLVPPEAAAPAPPPEQPAGDDSTEQRPATKPKLAHVVPDATAPRWPVPLQTTHTRQTTGAQDGVFDTGAISPRGEAPAFGADFEAPAWCAFCRDRIPTDRVPRETVAGVRAVALLTTIFQTGPPSA